ncbi:MAG: hypothetical protein JXN63_00950 [Candidatus Delongbacteria bacterium]|nr:hypothetical protein [Candidatus Delongbacteria bacterium]
MLKGFIPATKKEVEDLKWKKPDVIIVTGDAYIDHPYFQVASAGRFLNSKGFRTAILDMPDVDSNEDWKRYPEPKYFFLVITGKEDSMAMNYTAFKKFRSTDPYVPGGKRTVRPDRAAIKYCNKLKELYKTTPIILAGAEAAGRMLSHYDYWSDKLRKPVLFDTKADMLLYGSIEHNLVKICDLMKAGKKISEIKKLSGTAYIIKDIEKANNYVQLPSHESLEKNPSLLTEHHLVFHKNQNPYNSSMIIQRAVGRYMVVNKPGLQFTHEETDEIFGTGFKRRPHPKYKEEIPIFRFIKDIVITHRGCLNDIYDSQDILTEGKFISSRSNEEIRKETVKFIRSRDYNKMLRMFGLPYFNQYMVYQGNQKVCSSCERLSCTMPTVCPNIKTKNDEILKIMEGFDKFPNVRNNYYAGKPDVKLLLADKNFYKDYIMNRNDGNIEISTGSFYGNTRSLTGLDEGESAVKDIKFLIKRAGEYGKNVKFIADLWAGYPGQTDEEIDYNSKVISDLEIETGSIINFIPLPLTLAGALYFTGLDHETNEKINIEYKLSVMKKYNDWYKKKKNPKK